MMTILLTLFLALQGTTSATTTAPSADYIVGPQDKLNITVIPDVFSQQNVTVGSDGTFQYLALGPIVAKDLTVRQIQAKVRQLLVDKKQHNDPTVTVEVVAFRSQMVYVTGEGVRLPQSFQIQGSETLMSAIFRAGSFTSKAGSFVVISRKDAKGAPSEIKIPRKDVENGAGLAANFRLQDGDVITVDEAGRVHVQGEIRSPGTYDISEDAKLVLDMINAAGGFTDKANKGNVKIQRMVNGKPTEIKVPKELTMPVQQNDTILVPKRRF